MINSLLIALIMTVALHAATPAQNSNTVSLTGTVYDHFGAVIVGAEVAAVGENGSRYTARTNEIGIYELHLPYSTFPKLESKITKYDISANKEGFATNLIRAFRFVPANSGDLSRKQMNLDFALDIASLNHQRNSRSRSLGKRKITSGIRPATALMISGHSVLKSVRPWRRVRADINILLQKS